MKKIANYFIASLMLMSCNQPNANQTNPITRESIQEESFNHNFEEFGFALKAPCKMTDVSSQAKGDFLANYGGVTNPDDTNHMTAYQLIVSRLPVGYKDLQKKELDSKIDELIRSTMSNMNNLKSIRFGYEGYKGYVGETTHNGLKQKGVVFFKDGYTIALTVMTKDNLETKFNAFTNGFKSLKTTSRDDNSGNIVQNNAQNLSFGYTVSAPCTLKQYPSQDVDYSYSGALNPDNKDIAIVYKVQASSLPICYSQMNKYDQKQLKNNLLDYLRSKDNYSECKVGVQNHFAYKTTYSDSGFKFKECMLLTDKYVIELIVFSKNGVSDSSFMEFVNISKTK